MILPSFVKSTLLPLPTVFPPVNGHFVSASCGLKGGEEEEEEGMRLISCISSKPYSSGLCGGLLGNSSSGKVYFAGCMDQLCPDPSSTRHLQGHMESGELIALIIRKREGRYSFTYMITHLHSPLP